VEEKKKRGKKEKEGMMLMSLDSAIQRELLC